MRLKQLILAVLAVGLAACGGGVAKEDFGEQVTEALCERYARCGYYTSAEACERDWPQLAGDRFDLGTRYDEALASGRMRYDEDAAGRCIESIRDGECHLPALSRTALFEGLEYDPACQVLQVEEPATDCQLNLECGRHGYCAYAAANACQGRCEPRAQEGEAVTRSDACEPGLVAFISVICVARPGEEPTCSDPTAPCERPLEEGGDCRQENEHGTYRRLECADGLWCDGQGSGLCERLRPEGEACDELWGPPCEESLLCREGRCARYVREGERCKGPTRSGFLVNDECQRGLFCDAGSGESGTCRKPRAEGDACRLSALECADGMGCYQETEDSEWGTCRKRPGPGAGCDKDAILGDCAPGLTCSREYGKCVPFVHEGEPCGLLGECLGGQCSDEGRCLSAEAAWCGG